MRSLRRDPLSWRCLLPRLDAVARLQTLIPFARLSGEALATLADTVEWLEVPAGVRLFSEGGRAR